MLVWPRCTSTPLLFGSVRRNGKTYSRRLLRSSFREGGKVKHPRATTDKAVQAVAARIKRFRADEWLRAVATDRTISIEQDGTALQDAALLDGCYVIK